VEVCEPAPAVPDVISETTITVMIRGVPTLATRTIFISGTTLPPSCTTVAAGNTFQGCITDFQPGSITVDTSQPAVITGHNAYGSPMYSRPWSYSSTPSVYSTSCPGRVDYGSNVNSGMTHTTMGLANDLSHTTVLSSEAPILLQTRCSQEGMSQGWTTHDYANGSTYSGPDSGQGSSTSSSDCGCDGSPSGASSDCGQP
jgi:hypothetical protein